MAFGVKFYSQIKDIQSGSTFIVNIRVSGYTGTTTNIYHCATEPLTIVYDEQTKDSLDEPVRGSSATFSFWCDESAGENYNEFFTSRYGQYLLEVSGSTGLYWIGKIKPDNLTRPFLGTKTYPIQLNAICGLADLKTIPFPSTQVATGGSMTTGLTTIINAIKICVDQIGYTLPLADQMNISEHYLTSSQTPLLNLFIHKERFVSVSSGVAKYLNCYDVLSYLLEPFKAQIFQLNGKWYVQQKNETSSKKNVYNTNVTASTRTDYDRTITLNTGTTVFGVDSELSMIQPMKTVTVTFPNKVLTGTTNLVTNGTFASNINGWFNGTGATFFYQSVWDSGSGGIMYNDEPSIGNPNGNHQVYTVFPCQANATVDISADIKLAVETIGSGAGHPQIRYKLKAPNGSVVNSTPTGFTSVGVYQNFDKHFTISQNGNYTLSIEFIKNPSAGYIALRYHLDNVKINVKYSPSALTDTYYTGTISPDNGALITSDNTLRFLDSNLFAGIGAITAVNPITGTTFQWLNYPTRKTRFSNFTFSGGTLSPWATAVDGGTTSWSYNGGLSNDITAFGTIGTHLVYQTGFTAGNYTLNVSAKNNSTITGGINPNCNLVVYQYDGVTSRQLTTGTLTSDGVYHNIGVSFTLTGSTTTAIGFKIIRFGTGNQLDVGIAQVDITGYNAADYLVSLYKLYMYNTLRKNQTYRNYVRLTLRNRQNVFFNNILSIAGKKYEIIGYSNDLFNNKIDLQLAELLENGITLNYTSKNLTTIDGS